MFVVLSPEQPLVVAARGLVVSLRRASLHRVQHPAPELTGPFVVICGGDGDALSGGRRPGPTAPTARAATAAAAALFLQLFAQLAQRLGSFGLLGAGAHGVESTERALGIPHLGPDTLQRGGSLLAQRLSTGPFTEPLGEAGRRVLSSFLTRRVLPQLCRLGGLEVLA